VWGCTSEVSTLTALLNGALSSGLAIQDPGSDDDCRERLYVTCIIGLKSFVITSLSSFTLAGRAGVVEIH